MSCSKYGDPYLSNQLSFWGCGDRGGAKATRSLWETSTSMDEIQPNPRLSFFSPETISIATGKLESKTLDVQCCYWFARSALVSTVCMRQSRGPETLPTSVDALRICHGTCALRNKNSSPAYREADCSRTIHSGLVGLRKAHTLANEEQNAPFM